MANLKNAAWYGGGTVGIIGAQPSVGTVYYVNNASGSNSNNGLRPDKAFKTITYAITQASANVDDYIMVTNFAVTDETFPIAVNKAKLHLIGTPAQANPSPFINAPADTACLLLSASNIEVAGFEFSAGATHGCIETSGGVWKCHIHDNYFGWQDGAAYGIWLSNDVDAADCPSWYIHDNYFGRLMTEHNIYVQYNSTRSIIARNVFRGVVTGKIGIFVDQAGADLGAILDNTFTVADSADGEAITFIAGTVNCLVAGNRTGQGVAAMTQTPYRDLGANNWGINWFDIRAIMPVTV